MPSELVRPTPDVEEEALAALQHHHDALLIDRGKAECPGMLRRQEYEEWKTKTIFDCLPPEHEDTSCSSSGYWLFAVA
jgi:hypothetical protein